MAESREEAFEKIAFEMKEERDLAIYCLKNHVDPCDVCAKNPGYTEDCETWDCNCGACGNIKCACKFCGHEEEFYFCPVRAKEIKKKIEERRK